MLCSSGHRLASETRRETGGLLGTEEHRQAIELRGEGVLDRTLAAVRNVSPGHPLTSLP
jgi:hypothetical protein